MNKCFATIPCIHRPSCGMKNALWLFRSIHPELSQCLSFFSQSVACVHDMICLFSSLWCCVRSIKCPCPFFSQPFDFCFVQGQRFAVDLHLQTLLGCCVQNEAKVCIVCGNKKHCHLSPPRWKYTSGLTKFIVMSLYCYTLYLPQKIFNHNIAYGNLNELIIRPTGLAIFLMRFKTLAILLYLKVYKKMAVAGNWLKPLSVWGIWSFLLREMSQHIPTAT